MASLLSAALARLGIQSEWYRSPAILRARMDFNRPWSRDSLYRQQIEAAMRRVASGCAASGSSGGSCAWLLDMHSFPQGSQGFRGEVVLLSHPWGDNEPLARLADYLEQRGIVTSVIAGSQINDIQERARVWQMRSALVETSEELPEHRYREIADVIADFIKNDLDFATIVQPLHSLVLASSNDL
jgi:hypothetical protein